MAIELETKYKKIIYELDFNSRMSDTELGKKVGLSKQSVGYRLEKLEKGGIIQGYYTDINSSKLGLNIYLVYLNFSGMTSTAEKSFIKHLSKQKNIGVNSSVNGLWDYCIGIWAENIISFKRIYRKVMEKYERYVKDKTIMIETDFYYFKPRQIFDKKNNSEIKMEDEIGSYSLDEVDKKILLELSKNARISLVELSGIVGLTANGVKKRIDRLEKEKIILGYRVMINYSLLGFLHYRVFLDLENITELKEKEIIKFLGNEREVVSVTKTIGFCDLEFRCVVKNIEEYYLLIARLKEKFGSLIKDNKSIIYYKIHDVLNYFPF